MLIFGCQVVREIEFTVLDRTNHTAADRVAALVRRAMGHQSIAKPIGPDDDLRACGLSSLGLEVPEQEMTPTNFRTIARIVELVDRLSGTSSS
jgi:hypothetical protein